GNEPIDSKYLKFLLDEMLIIKNESNHWSLSQELIEVLNQIVIDHQSPIQDMTEDLDSLDTSSTILDTESSYDQSNKYRPVSKSKQSADFLDALNFDLKESNIQTRIKSQLQQSLTDAQDIITVESQASGEIDDLFDDALGETMEDFLSDFEDVILVEKEGGKPVISGPLIDILKEQGYIKGDLSTEEELQQVPEYEVLRTIIKKHPIPLTDLEEKTSVASLSLVLSNLQADNLIVYTNDYQWTISNKVKENLIEFMQSKDSSLDEIENLRLKIHRQSKYERQFVNAMYKLNFVESYDIGLIEMMQIPEFAIMKAIKNNEPVDFDRIQKVIPDIPPVQVTRILAQLEGDNRILKNSDGLWELSDQFVRDLVKE
ncbi:MAG: hypothetical protein ACC656_09490, partial [Candidatus Heimdallarchaeota archaeon]